MFLLLPNNLFENLSSDHSYVLYEHPLFFSSKKRVKRFHIKKLVLHRASMRYFYDQNKDRLDISYVECGDRLPKRSIKDMFEPCDKLIEREFNGVSFHTNPLFLHSVEDIESYKSSTRNDRFQETFKLWSMRRLGLKGLDVSCDRMNRKKYRGDADDIPEVSFQSDTDRERYIREAFVYVKKHFSYIGEFDGHLEYPITTAESKSLFIDFCKNRLVHYGDYQDYVDKEKQVMYHSMISSSLNIGIVDVRWVLQELNRYRSKVRHNQYEAFVRQIVGWREYERYLYHFYYDEMIGCNYFGNHKRLGKGWFESGKNPTGVLPIDSIINRVMRTAYMNHIERLMFVLNYMTLAEICFQDMYQWFMSVSIDSYDWVMVSNVSSMSYYYPKAMRKPYLASSNYMVKMSNYAKGEWCKRMDDMFYGFIIKKQSMLMDTIYKRNIYYAMRRGRSFD